jgi:hypothetical protein
MKGIRVMAAMLAAVAVALVAGCSTFKQYGVTESAVALAVRAAVEKEGFGDAITDDQIKEVIAIVAAQQRLNEIAEAVAADPKVAALAEKAVKEYLKK